MRIAAIHSRSLESVCRGLVPDEVLDATDMAHRAAAWKNRLSDPAESILVAISGSRMAGFCALFANDDGRTAEIASFHIDPVARGRGAGADLMEELVGRLRGRGFSRITLWVLAGNSRGRKFVERAGFERDGEERESRRGDYPVREVEFARNL